MSEEKKAFTVTQALGLAKRGLEQIRVSIVGEVSEFNDKPGYKAAYFTIRDDDCALPCQMWRDAYNASGVQLRPGLLVQVTGMFSCYPAKGRMQFTVRKMALAGEGNLRVKVAQLAAKLELEGLMDPARKRRPPALPQRIAVVTSPRGKAIHDVIRTLRRRYPLGELLVFGVPVEGEKAPQYMQEALAAAQQTQPAPDVILLVRGGGSYEDLMPFNDEGLARAIAACTVPVVTGIGHEPDNSIADMVADRRYSTPTAAAEKIAPSIEELRGKVDNATRLLQSSYLGCVDALRNRLSRLEDRPLWKDSSYLTGGNFQELDFLSERLSQALPRALESSRARLRELDARLKSGLPGLLEGNVQALSNLEPRLLKATQVGMEQNRARLDASQAALVHGGEALLRDCGQAMSVSAAKLEALSPLKTLSRGYSITYGQDGVKVIDSVEKTAKDEHVKICVSDGQINCTVDFVERMDSHE